MKVAGTKRIAERYVRSLFDVARDASALEQVEKDLQTLEESIEKSEDFRNFLSNPLIPRDHQADAMVSVAANLQAHPVTRQFVAMLTRQKRLALLPDIIRMFTQWAAHARGEMQAELVSAGPLKPADVALVADRLSQASGRKVNLDVRQDPALLGGLVVKVGSQQLDASLAGKIARLKTALQAA